MNVILENNSRHPIDLDAAVVIDEHGKVHQPDSENGKFILDELATFVQKIDGLSDETDPVVAITQNSIDTNHIHAEKVNISDDEVIQTQIVLESRDQIIALIDILKGILGFYDREN